LISRGSSIQGDSNGDPLSKVRSPCTWVSIAGSSVVTGSTGNPEKKNQRSLSEKASGKRLVGVRIGKDEPPPEQMVVWLQKKAEEKT